MFAETRGPMRVKQCWVFTFYRLSSVPLTAGFCNTRVFSINLENPSVGSGVVVGGVQIMSKATVLQEIKWFPFT